jgi:hypothetical protein
MILGNSVSHPAAFFSVTFCEKRPWMDEWMEYLLVGCWGERFKG